MFEALGLDPDDYPKSCERCDTTGWVGEDRCPVCFAEDSFWIEKVNKCNDLPDMIYWHPVLGYMHDG